MKTTKNRLTRGLAAGLAVVTIVGTFAIFTDRYQSTATAKAGSLDLQLTQTWAADNEVAISKLAPGDILHLNYTLKNDSTLSAKVREFFTISSDKEIPADTFQIYKLSDLVKDADTGMYAPIKDDGVARKPIAKLTDTAWSDVDGIMYSTYAIPQFGLDGTHPDQKIANVNDLAPNTDANADGQIYANTDADDHYVILFNKNAVTSVAGAKIQVKYLAEAIQHAGTGADVTNADKWTEVATAYVDVMPGVTQAADKLTFNPLIPTNP